MLRLAPCNGTAHIGETTLTADELQTLRMIVSHDDVEKKDVVNVLKTLKPTLNNEYDIALILEAEKTLSGKGTRSQTLGKAINYLITILDRVFPRSVGGRKKHKSSKSKSKSKRKGTRKTRSCK
jgi:hypothetical protein